jgi:hypothetical protein
MTICFDNTSIIICFIFVVFILILFAKWFSQILAIKSTSQINPQITPQITQVPQVTSQVDQQIIIDKLENPFVPPERIYPNGRLDLPGFSGYQVVGFLYQNTIKLSLFGKRKYPLVVYRSL